MQAENECCCAKIICTEFFTVILANSPFPSRGLLH